MRNQQFEAGRSEIRRLQSEVRLGAHDVVETVQKRAFGMVVWAETLLLKRFGFMIPDPNVRRIRLAIERVEVALDRGDPELRSAVSELDNATDDLPPFVLRLLIVEARIRFPIAP